MQVLSCTIIYERRSRSKDPFALVIHPSGDRNKVCYVARDLALQKGIIAENDVLHLDIDVVRLANHLKEELGT